MKECLDGGERQKRICSPSRVSPPEQSDVTGIVSPATTALAGGQRKNGQPLPATPKTHTNKTTRMKVSTKYITK